MDQSSSRCMGKPQAREQAGTCSASRASDRVRSFQMRPALQWSLSACAQNASQLARRPAAVSLVCEHCLSARCLSLQDYLMSPKPFHLTDPRPARAGMPSVHSSMNTAFTPETLYEVTPGRERSRADSASVGGEPSCLCGLAGSPPLGSLLGGLDTGLKGEAPER